MVRVFIKGGVWKNSEDEILKAAVMKYGKQQWARVASLLNRKSAKQCKARWNEWLDPSVRKVEWSRAEDEKLLHLAKLLPAQWRTVGPLVGRTATQCQERYERLLDEAASAAAAAAGGEGVPAAEGAEGDAADEHAAAAAAHARKLRPGQIDPHPETRPARPDPVDMDEDEIEMLQEARARLANTQGKKAKRKERERMLAEAKRLADLQKRRELKQAGLLSGAARSRSRTGKKRRREIDFGVEIPFHKPAPAGFHSTASEDAATESARAKRAKSVDYRRVNEAQYRSRDRDAQLSQKKEEARLRSLERSNMQYVVAEVSKRNDPVGLRKRGALEMPAPAVTDEELERVARLGREQGAAGLKAPPPGAAGASATDALLGDYSDRPLPTPMRTPMLDGGDKKPSAQEVILREASNLRMLERGQTPLLGGDNPELRAGGAGTGIGIEGAAKTTEDVAASAATPMLGAGKTPSATPMTSRGPGSATPSRRDELGLNRPSSQMHPGMSGGDDVSVSATSFATTAAGTSVGMSIKELARAERKAAKAARLELEAALAALPAPQFEYELAAPDAVTEDDVDGQPTAATREKDAADVEREEAEARRKEAEKLYEERSTAVKRPELPRPVGAVTREALFGNGNAAAEEKNDDTNTSDAKAEELVREEMLTLLQYDAHAHPVPMVEVDGEIAGVDGGKKRSKKDKKKKKRKKGGKEDAGAAGMMMAPPPERPLDYLPEEALESAKGLVEQELAAILKESGNDGSDLDATLVAKNVAASAEGASSLVYFDAENGDGAKGWTDSENNTSPASEIDALRAEHDALSTASALLRKKADKLEARLTLRHGGYIKRYDALRSEALRSHAELRHAAIEEGVYATLLAAEGRGAQSRIEGLENEVKKLEEDEAASQRRYGELLRERNRVRVLARQGAQKQGE